MKKVTFLLISVFIIALSSCSKEKDCKCVTAYSGEGAESMSDVEVRMTIQDGSCSDGNSSVTTAGISVITTCSEQ